MIRDNDSFTHDPYLINSHQEIDNILVQLLQRGILLRMHSGTNPHAVITTLLDIDFENGTVIIDSATQQTMNRQLVSEETAYFEALLDQISIQFQISPIAETTFEGQPALMGALPNTVRRLQRRENYRIQPSTSNPVFCILELSPPIQLHVFDISSGGVSFLEQDAEVTIPQGKIINATLLLPDTEPLRLELQIIRYHQHTLASGRKMQRIGCSFFQLSGQNEIRIQNYINQEERLNIARNKGLN